MPHPYELADAEAYLARAMACDWERHAEFVIEHHTFGVVGSIGFTPQARRAGGDRLLAGPALLEPRLRHRGGARARCAGRSATGGEAWSSPATSPTTRRPARCCCKAGFLYTGDVELRPCAARDGAQVPTRMMVWLA